MTRAGGAAVALGAALLMAGCTTGRQASLPARGPAAAQIESLWWLMLAVLGAAAVATIVGLAVAALRRRRSGEEDAAARRRDARFLLAAGVIFPTLVIVLFLVRSVLVGREVVTEPPGIRHTVEVIGHQYWWEVRYPDFGVVTANEIHIPAGEPVRFRLSSADVIHSFWVPALQGKADMLPGRTDSIWLQADAPGVYRGVCAEFCGVQHALMAFDVVALPPAEFERWVVERRRGPPEPTTELERRGREVFFAARCQGCHAIRGVTPPSRASSVGPDLTDLARRRTLAAGTLPNNPGHLGGWLLDPQSHKPGNRMPATVLEPEALHALLAYLETLK